MSRSTAVPASSGVEERRVAMGHRVVAVAAFAVFTAVAARVAVPLPGLAVPMTLQVVAVLLAGAVLGPRLGFASQTVYLAMGAAGLPVFAAGGGVAYLAGPTGGYLIAFPIAAALAGVGFGVRKGWPGQLAGLLTGLALVHASGAAWLGLISGAHVSWSTQVAPFFVGDMLKIALVLLLGSAGRRRIQRWLT